MKMTLEELRAHIDAIDREIIERLHKRVDYAAEIGHIKKQKGEAIYVPAREEEVFRKLEAINQGVLPKAALRAIYREVISASIQRERPLRVAYLGPEATYTHQAAQHNFGSSQSYFPCPVIPDVFSAVQRGEADYGVIPIENSSEGSVFHSMDMLAETDLKIVAEVYLPVEHCLLSHEPLEKIQVVYSKDQALGQCREWLQRNLPGARREPSDSTASAVKSLRPGDGRAALAGRLAGELYGVPVVAAAVQDRADNVTRFLVIGTESGPRVQGVPEKTSVVISILDRVGVLSQALECFGKRAINLTRIESRPSRRKAWDYLFFIDFSGHWLDEKVQEAMHELEENTKWIKWLGSYPNNRRGDDGEVQPPQ